VTFRGIGLLTNSLFGATSKANAKRRLSTTNNKNNVSYRKIGSLLEGDEVNILPRRRTQQVSDATTADDIGEKGSSGRGGCDLSNAPIRSFESIVEIDLVGNPKDLGRKEIAVLEDTIASEYNKMSTCEHGFIEVDDVDIISVNEIKAPSGDDIPSDLSRHFTIVVRLVGRCRGCSSDKNIFFVNHGTVGESRTDRRNLGILSQ
jgi:hypothetical protein